MLHDLHRKRFVPQRPESGNVIQHQGIAVNKDGPALVVTQPGNEETRKREFGGLSGVLGAGEHALQVLQRNRGDGNWPG